MSEPCTEVTCCPEDVNAYAIEERLTADSTEVTVDTVKLVTNQVYVADN